MKRTLSGWFYQIGKGRCARFAAEHQQIRHRIKTAKKKTDQEGFEPPESCADKARCFARQRLLHWAAGPDATKYCFCFTRPEEALNPKKEQHQPQNLFPKNPPGGSFSNPPFFDSPRSRPLGSPRAAKPRLARPGGIKPNISNFGADQFDSRSSLERKDLEKNRF